MWGFALISCFCDYREVTFNWLSKLFVYDSLIQIYSTLQLANLLEKQSTTLFILRVGAIRGDQLSDR